LRPNENSSGFVEYLDFQLQAPAQAPVHCELAREVNIDVVRARVLRNDGELDRRARASDIDGSRTQLIVQIRWRPSETQERVAVPARSDAECAGQDGERHDNSSSCSRHAEASPLLGLFRHPTRIGETQLDRSA
jgi:hypothetical protein